MTFWSACEILKTSVLEFWDSFQLVESAVRSKSDADDGLRTWGPVAQILLPIAALALVWGQKGFVSRFFLQFDKNCVSVFCPSFSKRERLLKWASGRLPPAWSSHANTLPGGPSEFWRDGSLLCTLINSAIPGACPNPHRHWRKPPSHGQALAFKYLGIPPVFTEQDFIHHRITPRQERILFDYLVSIQQAIAKVVVNDVKYSSRYAARGMGLTVGEQLRKASFYIYSSSTTSSSKHDVLVSIRGPYNSYSTVTIPAHYVTKKHIRSLQEKKKLDYQSRAQKSFFRSLSVDLAFFININQKSELNTIPVKLVSETDRVKVVFIPKSSGIHEVSIITNGFHLVGSPFSVNVVENSSGVVDAFDEHPYKRSKRRTQTKKIVSKIIDFVDEKINYDNIRAVPSYLKNIPRLKVNQERTPSECAEKIEEAYSFRQKAQDKISIKEKIDEEPENERNELESGTNFPHIVESEPTSPVGGSPTENEVTSPVESPEVSTGNQRTRTLQRQRRINFCSDAYGAFTAIPQKTKLCLSRSYSESSFNDYEKQKPRSNSLSILNYLSSLKCEDKYIESSRSESSLSDRGDENKTVQQRLQFWERHSVNISPKSSDSSLIEKHQETLPPNSQTTNISLKHSALLPTEKHQQEKLMVQQRTQFWERQNSLNISSHASESSLTDKYQQQKLPSLDQTSHVSAKHSESSSTDKYQQEKLMVQQRTQFWERQNGLNISSSHPSESSLTDKYQQQKLPPLDQTNNVSPKHSESSLTDKYQQEKLVVQQRTQFWERQNSQNISSHASASSLTDKYQQLKLAPVDQTDNISAKSSESSLTEKYQQEKLMVQQRTQFWERQNSLHFSSHTSESPLTDKYQQQKLPPINQTNISPKHSESSLTDKYQQEKLMVQQRMQFWEDQNFVSSKPRLKSRQSLPDLLPFSERLHKSDSQDFKMQFKARQEYWKTISSQSSSNSSLASSTYYIETLGKLKKPKTTSLPDIFSEEIYNELAFRNFVHCDFFNSDEARDFKSTFKERRDFWEALSAKTLLFNRKSPNGSVENCYDSGFFNGTNLSAESLESLRQYSDSLKFKLQYEEKKKFWECLSRPSSSNCSADWGYRLYHLQNAKHPVKEDFTLKELMSLKKTKKRKTDESTLQKEDEGYHLEDINLTDDIKQKQDMERTKQQFESAKNYFLSLEKCCSLEGSCK